MWEPNLTSKLKSKLRLLLMWQLRTIDDLSPTRRNVQTTTKSFVDKRRPRQNGVPDRHVGNKLSFQVNWTLWIDSIALSSSDHPSSIQNDWSIRSVFTAFSLTWRNVQTTTKSFVDKRWPQLNGVPDQHVGNKLSFQVNWTLWINSIALSSSDHPSSIQNHWWIRSVFTALSPTRWNVQTTTKSFVDKKGPWQNGVPDWHVCNKLSFQVNWTLWIDSIALSSSDHPSSIQNHWWIRSGFLLSPHLDETSKPQQNHLLIKEGPGITEYLINTWATNWVFKSIERFESTA